MLTVRRNNDANSRLTLNGKLIVQKDERFQEVLSEVRHLAETVEQLDRRTLTLNQKESQDSLERFKGIKLSIHNLEQVSRRWVGVTVGTALALGVLGLLGDLAPRNCSPSPRHLSSPIPSISKP